MLSASAETINSRPLFFRISHKPNLITVLLIVLKKLSKNIPSSLLLEIMYCARNTVLRQSSASR